MHEDTEGWFYSQPWCCHFSVMRNVSSDITDSNSGLLPSVSSRAGERWDTLLGGVWGNSTGAVRLGKKTWEKTLVQALEKSVVPETQSDMAVLPALLVTSELSHCWLPFFRLVRKPLALGSAIASPQTHLTCPSLSLCCAPSPVSRPHRTSMAQLHDLASQSQPSHHMLLSVTSPSLPGQLVGSSPPPFPVSLCHQDPPLPRQTVWVLPDSLLSPLPTPLLIAPPPLFPFSPPCPGLPCFQLPIPLLS